MTDTEISPIANDAAYAAIVEALNECRAEYAAMVKLRTEDHAEDDADDVESDVLYMDKVMMEFEETRDFAALISNLGQQDSYVREFYATVIEDVYSAYFMGQWE